MNKALLMQQAVIIPAYKPGDALVMLTQALLAHTDVHIVIVDDGSGEPYHRIFSSLTSDDRVVLLRHQKNQGKGVALKTALAYYCQHRQEGALGVVTADADGQHALKDIIRLLAQQRQAPETLWMGVRDISAGPQKNQVGNRVVEWCFWYFIGLKLSDTQTGLRALPNALIPILLKVPGRRYQYETEMLIRAKREAVAVKPIPVETIYPENNQSHYLPSWDTTLIVLCFFRNLTWSIVMAFFCFIVFVLGVYQGHQPLVMVVLSRVLFTALHVRGRKRVFNLTFDGPHVLLPWLVATMVNLGLLGWLLPLSFPILLVVQGLIEFWLLFFSFGMQRLYRKNPLYFFTPPAA